MNSDLTHALNQFEATEANLVKLETLWKEIQKCLGSANSNCHNPEHEAACDERSRTFRQIAAVMPKIDGYELGFEIDRYLDVFMEHHDANEVGEFQTMVTHLAHSTRQGPILDEYRFRFNAKRRELAGQTVEDVCGRVEKLLDQLVKMTASDDVSKPLPPEHLDQLRQEVKSIDALLGSTIKRGGRWDMLLRHVHFGTKCDLNDIVEHDWPSVKEWLEKKLYGEDDPLPVKADDLGALVASKPSGPVVTELKWSDLKDDDFERLIFNLITGSDGYENAEWLTKINAPDRGRDLSVQRVFQDPLSGSRRERVIIACKHYTSKSVNLAEIAGLQGQMKLWDSPRVDVLIVATSGRFTNDAVDWIEKHNRSNEALRIEMWPDSQLEHLLAKRPDLIAEFGLR